MSFPEGVLVDDDVLSTLGHHKWRIENCAGYLYVKRYYYVGRKHKCVYLHREIMDAASWVVLVDHRNGDTLDNRRENLRCVSRSGNGQNRVKLVATNTSGFRGVSWDKSKSRWVAQAVVNQRPHFIGRFVRKEDAAAAVQAWRQKYMPLSEQDQIAV